MYDASKIKENLLPSRTVVDLHIEKITDKYEGLSNFEILTMQLNTFEKYYDLAVAHKQKMFTVIHGIGEGKLKDEIHDILKLKKEVKSFVNQYRLCANLPKQYRQLKLKCFGTDYFLLNLSRDSDNR